MDVKVTSNADKVRAELREAVAKALETCGQLAEGHAKANITAAGRVDTGNMRNSVSHAVKGDDCYIGTNNEYAVYHEVGTGIYTDPAVGRGRQTPWRYKDDKGQWHVTRGLKPIHFLKKAIQDHKTQYIEIIREELKS